MHLLQRYRLSITVLVGLLAVLALAYAVQSSAIRALRTQNTLLKRQNCTLEGINVRLTDAANSAVYKFLLPRAIADFELPLSKKVTYLDIADEDICSEYNSRDGFACDSPPPSEEERHIRRRGYGADYAMVVHAPVWNGNRATVRIVLHNDTDGQFLLWYEIEYSQRRIILRSAVGSSEGFFPTQPVNSP